MNLGIMLETRLRHWYKEITMESLQWRWTVLGNYWCWNIKIRQKCWRAGFNLCSKCS